MIKSFYDKHGANLWAGKTPKQFRTIERQALKRMDDLNAALSFKDLIKPGNHLKTLKGNRKGQLSIRINNQYRICFDWNEEKGEAENVEITDYH